MTLSGTIDHAAGPSPEETFTLSPEEAEQDKRQLAQYRRMLAQNGGRARLHTLIIEDQHFSRELLGQILRETCSVRTSATVKEGWKRYLEEVPDIVFLDIGLPDVSGHGLADKIKELDPVSYVVMVTASHDVYDLQMAKGNRVDGFIVKPFNKQKIAECIDRCRTVRDAKTGVERAS